MVRIAVIGAGRIGTVHAATVARHPHAQLVLVHDPVGNAAEQLAAAHGARATHDLTEVLEADDVDAVIIGSPTPVHVDQLVRAVRAGKAVLCEKPVDLDLARVDECIAAISGHEDRVMVGFNRRFDPTFAEIHARVQQGEIGPVEQLTIISRDPAPPTPEYVRVSGGLFRDMTIHDLDTARHFLGEIVEVSAVGQRLDPAFAHLEDVDGAVTTLVAASGAVATIINSRHCATGYDQRLEVFGPLGALEAVNPAPTSVRHSSATSSGASGPYLTFFLERYTQAYSAELGHFVDAVRTGRAPSPTIEDGRAALELAEAATRSAATGERVRLSRTATTRSQS